MTLLKNKNIVIIGGTTGIGLSAAKAFVDNGANVIVVGRNAESAGAAKKELGDKSEAIVADAVQPDTTVNAIETCINKYGSFDGLYHVAGGSGRKMGDGPLDLLTLEGWNKTIELNLTSLMLSNQAAVRNFLHCEQVAPF
jgi:NAD(P)-dependent dehydrogenase (short-subunit alcohol dehydrogenase family)